MITLTDQLGRELNLAQYPTCIISTVPSQTELLFYLGLDAEIAGITKFCIHPLYKVNRKLKIGGTKQLNIQLIKKLKPDLIIANKEENDKQQLEGLMADYPVYMSDPFDLPSALHMISDMGTLVNRRNKAVELILHINQQFKQLQYLQPMGLRVAYLIWQNPYMAAGKGTFINDMLSRCGFANIFDEPRYPEVTIDKLIQSRPDVILLSSEPYPFKQKHVDEFTQLLPGTVIKLVNGELFSWYGSRLLHAPQYFITLTDSVQQALN